MEKLELLDVSLPATFVVTGKSADPSNVDFDILGLHKKRTYVKGELISVEYYLQYNPNIDLYSGLAVREQNEYVRVQGYVVMRQKKIEWLLSNGLVGLTKNTVKYYDLVEAMEEGITRRRNILSQLKAKAIMYLGEANGMDLWPSIKDGVELYADAVTQPLIDLVATIEKPYLDALTPDGSMTVRAFFLAELAV